jgi:hypothetical protein
VVIARREEKEKGKKGDRISLSVVRLPASAVNGDFLSSN